jgi:ankyrin repeat protein
MDPSEQLYNIASGAAYMPNRVNMNRVIELVEQHGANVNYAIDHSGSPSVLIAACYTKNVQFVAYLVSRGADVNYKSAWSITPLYVAISTRSLHIIECLLQNGADPNLRCRLNIMPIFYAETPQTIDLLVKYGADPFETMTLTEFYRFVGRLNNENQIRTIQTLMITAAPNKNKARYNTPMSQLPSDLHRELTNMLLFSKKKNKRNKKKRTANK